jgi:hypothetical protein
MSLPMDISTALWWRSVPLWEWEALPPAPAAGDAAAAKDTAPPPDAMAPCAASAPGAAPAAQPGTERDGFRLVFKGYEISASVFWYPADSALSRPWLRHDEPAADRRPDANGDDAAARAESLQRAAAARELDGEAEGNAQAGPA